VESIKLEFDLQFFDVSCNRINFIQEVTRGTVHIHEPGIVEKFALDDGVTLGCHVRGSNIIDKVGGNFRFAIQPAPFSPDRNAVPGQSSNISHIVRHVAFVPILGDSAAEKLPELAGSLRNQETNVPEGTGLYQYAVQVRIVAWSSSSRKAGGIMLSLIFSIICFISPRWCPRSTKPCMVSCHLSTNIP
jgi:hypothetical protein